ncbi:MAG: thiamine-phosphate kinase [Planctomycetota bacterium]
MRRAAAGELAFIDWIRKRIGAPAGGRRRTRLLSTAVGPGDDCALLACGAGGLVAITTDMLLEGAHFSTTQMSAERIGRKALAVGLSDVAAMGMEPAAAVVAAALSRKSSMEFARRLMRGMMALARRHRVEIVGGDVTSWSQGIVLCVTVLGRPCGAKPVLRSGARVGDDVFVTGPLGGSILRKHWAFEPLVADGAALARRYRVHAMIDVSDGLSTDLMHICEESGAGATIEAAGVPVSATARTLARRDGRSPLEHALHDGEDFELLFTADPRGRARILEGRSLTRKPRLVGRIEREPGLRIRDPRGKLSRLEPRGYEHTWG